MLVVPKAQEISKADYTTHYLSDSSDAEFSDAETLHSRRSLELIELGSIDSKLKEVSELESDLGSDSTKGEDSTKA